MRVVYSHLALTMEEKLVFSLYQIVDTQSLAVHVGRSIDMDEDSSVMKKKLLSQPRVHPQWWFNSLVCALTLNTQKLPDI